MQRRFFPDKKPDAPLIEISHMTFRGPLWIPVAHHGTSSSAHDLYPRPHWPYRYDHYPRCSFVSFSFVFWQQGTLLLLQVFAPDKQKYSSAASWSNTLWRRRNQLGFRAIYHGRYTMSKYLLRIISIPERYKCFMKGYQPFM